VCGRIVEAHDRKLSCPERDESRLIHQQHDLIAVGQLDELVRGNAAKMIVVAQSHVNRGYPTELREKAKEVRDASRHVQEISGHEDPVRPQASDLMAGVVVAGKVAVQMQVGDVDGTTPSQRWVATDDARDVDRGKSEFVLGEKVEKVMKRDTQAVAEEEPHSIEPPLHHSDQPRIWLRARLSQSVKR
jgi:hypothetical protein